MESAAVLRTLTYSIGRPGIFRKNNGGFSGLNMKCFGSANEVTFPDGLEKRSMKATFPNVFEDLVTQVCDQTEIAELKVKVGGFQMNLKRNLASAALPPLISSPPPAPTTAKPAEKVCPFTNVGSDGASKLAALEASGATGYVLVASSTVGSFRRSQTLKGKKQPPACKEGDMIKEGQVIGFVDQFANELAIRSDVSGEVLKVLYQDGEAVGYGDPLIAVLPSFHGIE
ncbi:hypothetical protein LIER_34369 [Lithospermum erythrorhizon]|uniref:Lipoyl-binding domain-containing protein n=1 Tax=Lithospermum erythrorhizon TaxID=34254 RepID=A0AAV3S3K8_LITER